MGAAGAGRGRIEEEVGAGAGGGEAGRLGGPEGAHGAGFERVGDRDALRSRAGERSSPVVIARREGRRLPGEGRVDRGAQHHHLAAGREEARIRRLVDPAQGRLREADPSGGVSRCWRWPTPNPGKCLPGRGDPAALESFGERHRRRRHGRRGRAEAAVCFADVTPGTGDIEVRREVDVDADVAQVPRRAPALRAAEGGAPLSHHFGRGARRTADPLHQPALLVDHHQQRVAQAAAGGGSPGGSRSACGRLPGWGGCRCRRRGSPRRPSPSRIILRTPSGTVARRSR